MEVFIILPLIIIILIVVLGIKHSIDYQLKAIMAQNEEIIKRLSELKD